MAAEPKAETVANPGHEFDHNLRDMLEWHFSPATGSRFWLDRRADLDFDPLRDIHTAADLVRFPDLSADLRTAPAEDLIPRGLSGNHFRVFDSGGTSGVPKRIVDTSYRAEMVPWIHKVLVSHGVPETGNWLHVGPTGPHVAAFHNARYAEFGHGILFTIDMDPRWVKRLVASGKQEMVEDYVEHVLDQAHAVLSTQDVAVMWITPPALERLCARPDLYELVRSKVRAIVWGGTTFSSQSRRELEENFFPDTAIVGMYGNTLMGSAPQRPRQHDDEYSCVFEPYAKTTRVELIDDDGNQVDYGQRGQVRFHLVTQDLLLPSVVERDTAIRVRPREGATADGIAELRTLASFDNAELIEGVY